MLAALTLAVALVAAPATTSHHIDPACRGLNHTETQLCQRDVQYPSYFKVVARPDGTVVRIPMPSGRQQVNACRDHYKHAGKGLTACLAAIHGPIRGR